MTPWTAMVLGKIYVHARRPQLKRNGLSCSTPTEQPGVDRAHYGLKLSAWRVAFALVGSALGATSSALLLLLIPLWGTALVHRRLQIVWIFAGMLTALLAAACGAIGASKLRRSAILSVVLLPLWYFVAALFLKAGHD